MRYRCVLCNSKDTTPAHFPLTTVVSGHHCTMLFFPRLKSPTWSSTNHDRNSTGLSWQLLRWQPYTTGPCKDNYPVTHRHLERQIDSCNLSLACSSKQPPILSAAELYTIASAEFKLCGVLGGTSKA